MGPLEAPPPPPPKKNLILLLQLPLVVIFRQVEVTDGFGGGGEGGLRNHIHGLSPYTGKLGLQDQKVADENHHL